jgi:homocitrate synthase NifV
VAAEVQLNDLREIPLLKRYALSKNIRLVGLDDLMCHDYVGAFQNIRRQMKGAQIELCPENGFHCATAIAVEWILQGGSNVAASFGGVGGKAPLEEVLLALRIQKRHKTTATYDGCPRIAALLEEILTVPFDDRKAVIGRKIFDVESGIHVDGILKQPKMYEPYHPVIVGGTRKIVIGKHSGRKAVSSKLSELGLPAGDYPIAEILSEVRSESVKKMSGLTDDEFLDIVRKFRK